MNLLVINGINFTQHIKVPSYKVIKEEKYKEWEDGNYVKHREITRKKASGTFTMYYDDNSELDQFLDTVEGLKASSTTGAIPITVYLNNLHTVETINAFIKYNLANERPNFITGELSGFEVTIEER